MNTNKIIVLNNAIHNSRLLAKNFLMSMNAELETPIEVQWLDKIFSHAVIITIGDENTIEGWLVLYCNDYNNYVAYVAGLHILKPYRGSGYSKMLLSKAIIICKEKGMRKLTLFCKTDNIIALTLYLNWGFEEEYREIMPQYGNQEYAFLSLSIN